MATRYEAPGKQSFRELLLALATQDDVRTYGTFWGYGADSRMFSAAGFDVVACEIVQAKHDALVMDALTHGYRTHLGRAGKVTERFDMFHADFDGGPSPANFREVRRIAAVTDRWLAVTIAMDHQRDESMMGEAAFYTIPAWLTGASGFTLEYLSRYKRNEYGQVMWVAILQRRAGRGVAHQVLPVQTARSIDERGYWASRPMYLTGLMSHRQEPRTPTVRAGDARRYLAKKTAREVRETSCRSCGVEFIVSDRLGRPRSTCSARCRKVAKSTYHRDWYQRKLAAVSGTTAEAILAA